MCRSGEGKGGAGGLITSAQTGRRDRFISKNTVRLVLESVRIYSLVYSHSSVGSQVKGHCFAEATAKNTLIPRPFTVATEGGGEMESSLEGTINLYGA